MPGLHPRLAARERRPVVAALALLLLAAVLPGSVSSAATYPPSDVRLAPPPVPTMPGAGTTTPPSHLIADPITPQAQCGPWTVQSAYGGIWPTDQSWWEFSCVYAFGNCIGVSACNADQHSNDHTTYVDRFVYDGSTAVFYGERYEYFYFDSYVWEGSGCDLWWDQAAAHWYVIPIPTCPLNPPAFNFPPEVSAAVVECSSLVCDFSGGGYDPDGAVAVENTWSHGDGSTSTEAWHTYTYATFGSYIATLTVTDADGATATREIQVTVANKTPLARMALECIGLACSFDGRSSLDTDGSVVDHRWAFGDGTTASGAQASHTYAALGRYAVSLTVKDDLGVSASVANDLALIGLQATVSRAKGSPQVALSWTGAAGATFAVHRNGVTIGTVQGHTLIDVLGRRSGPVTYTVCQDGTTICSGQVTVVP